MDEYKKEYRRVEIRHCEKNTDQVSTVACKKCNQVLYARCLMRVKPCTDSKFCRL